MLLGLVNKDYDADIIKTTLNNKMQIYSNKTITRNIKKNYISILEKNILSRALHIYKWTYKEHNMANKKIT